jgi:hypothetical protein
VFCGILAEWVSNIKEIQIYLADYAGRKYTEGPLKSKEAMAGFFAVLRVMVNHAGRKPLAWYVENQFWPVLIRKHAVGVVLINIGKVLNIN